MAYSLSSTAVAANQDVTERKVLAEEYAARAVELLRNARDAGFFQGNQRAAARLAIDPALAPLRDRDDFKRLLAELAKQAAEKR